MLENRTRVDSVSRVKWLRRSVSVLAQSGGAFAKFLEMGIPERMQNFRAQVTFSVPPTLQLSVGVFEAVMIKML